MKVVIEKKAQDYDESLYRASRIDEEGHDGFELLDPGEIEQYQEQGYLVLRNALDKQTVDSAKFELENMASDDQPNCHAVYLEGSICDYHEGQDSSETFDENPNPRFQDLALGNTLNELPKMDSIDRSRFVRKFSGFVQEHLPLGEIAHHPLLMEIVKQLIGKSSVLFQDMAMIKPPGGREKPWHQDHAYFNLPVDTRIVGVWVALDRVTQDNGCMHVLSGGHQNGPCIHFLRRDWQICDEEMIDKHVTAIPMNAGDILLFDAKLPHGTPSNKTEMWRWALQFHYRPEDVSGVPDEVRLASFGSEGKNVTC